MQTVSYVSLQNMYRYPANNIQYSNDMDVDENVDGNNIIIG